MYHQTVLRHGDITLRPLALDDAAGLRAMGGSGVLGGDERSLSPDR